MYFGRSLKEKTISETQKILSITDHRHQNVKDIADKLRYMKTQPKQYLWQRMTYMNLHFYV